MPRYLLVFLVACGGGGSNTPPGDAGSDASPDASIDAPPDAPPDAPSTDPAILAVATTAGASEVRQDAEAHLVITGRNLDGASSVAIGSTAATIDSVSATEVRVSLYVPAVVGPQAVTVVASAGTVTGPAAIAVTPFVVSPTGQGGLGTYGSPLGLCDPEVELAAPGDTIELQDGTHACGRMVILQFGVTVAGAPGATAIVRGTAGSHFGFGLFAGPDNLTTTFRDLTFEEPLLGNSIDAYGKLLVQRVVDAGGIGAYAAATIDHYAFTGAGPAVDAQGSVQLASSAIHCTSGDGVVVPGGGSVTLDGVTVEGCATGLWVSGAQWDTGSAAVTGSDFVDNGLGIRITYGAATVTDTRIRDDVATPAASSVGLWVDTADVYVTTSHILDQEQVGIRVTSPSPNNGIDASLLDARGIEIVGGRVGISFETLDNHLVLRRSTIRDQTEAAFACLALDSVADLGRAGDPGLNALSVKSGFALDDQRESESWFYRYIYANGTTLNGVSFDGQTIEGAAEDAPHYRIRSGGSGIQF